MRAPRLIVLWGFLTGITAGFASAAPPSSIVEPIGEAGDKPSFTFRVKTPAVALSNLPDGSTQVRIDGFPGRDPQPGVPDLPFSVYRVAIPPGVVPRLTIDSVVEDLTRGMIPRPVPKVAAALDADATDPVEHAIETRVHRTSVFEPDPAVFEGSSPYPAQVARLGKIGTFRDQRYVEVLISPVRYDPKARGLRTARSITVTISFDGDATIRSRTPPDPRLEDLYREMFTNYAQGTMFRVGQAPDAKTDASAPVAPADVTAGPLYRIRVRANAMVRLDSSKLAGTGFDTQPLSTYKLTCRGVEVPILVNDANGNDHLDSGDWIQFYGQAWDDDPKTVLNTLIPGGTNIYELRDYSDEDIYFLSVEAAPHSRIAVRSSPPDLSAPATKFDAVAHLETDNAFRPLGDSDPWFWSPSQSSPPVSGSAASRTISVVLPGLASSTDPARVIVPLRGLTEDGTANPDHNTHVTLLNAASQSLMGHDGNFDGRTIYVHDFTWTYPGSGAGLTSPAQVTIDAYPVAASPGYLNNFILNYVEIQYKRSFQASADTLTFDYPDGNAEFLVTGLLTNAPEVWEVTGRVGTTPVVSPVRITSATIGGAAGNYSVRFHMTEDPSIPDGTPRRFVVTGSSAVASLSASDFTPDTVSDLRNTGNQADLIVIAHPTPLGATATPTLNALLAWKLANLGITSKVAMIQDVYDEFNNGLASPQAIKNFLSFVMSTAPGEGWSGRKPAWVLLIGDGSYDSKYNDTSVPQSNFVPTQIMFKDDPSFGYYASDSILTDVVGNDGLPDLVIGRISTRTDTQTNIVLQKLLDYQQNPPAGNWTRHSVLVSDRGKGYNATEAGQWEDTNAEAVSWLKLPPNTQRTMRYWTDYCGATQNGCTQQKADLLRSDIKKAVNGTDGISDGASMIQYTGHGNFVVWSDDAFFAEGWGGYMDVGSLTNGGKLPWLVVHNCLSAGFEDTNDVTLGEDWLKKSGGGSMAVYAPSGLNDSYNGFYMTDGIWGTLFGPTKDRMLGDAVASAINYVCGFGATQTCQNYVLLGDPSTKMVFTTVQPPTSLVAVAGNASVALSWHASATPGATYDVYRLLVNVDRTYTRVGAGLSATSFTDTGSTGPVNTKTYQYYVVALDTDKFESRWSNFNSDCAVNGPDCVSATPTNPNPPAAPSNVSVTDPETGEKLNLTWSANLESDFDKYTVWWGTIPGSYTSSGNAGKLTNFSIPGLTNGVTYYLAVTASNTSGRMSAYSTATGIPTFVRGVRSPAFIQTLRVSKSSSGTDAVLTWTAVTNDIYGKPDTVVSYEVYRGTTLNFVPAAGNRIGQPTSPTFTDPGALSGAAPNYYYLVRAIDASGNGGGLGNQLPNGVDTMTMSKTPDGAGGFTLGLAWPAVTTDFDGRPLAIAHYEVYATSHPFSRTDVRNGLVPLLGSPTTASFSLTAPGTSQYYSVLAVDARGNKSSF